MEQGPRDSSLKKLSGWRVVHSETSALVAAILILLRARGNQHLRLWRQEAEFSRIQNRPCYLLVLTELEQRLFGDLIDF